VLCPRTQHNVPGKGPFLEGPGNFSGAIQKQAPGDLSVNRRPELWDIFTV